MFRVPLTQKATTPTCKVESTLSSTATLRNSGHGGFAHAVARGPYGRGTMRRLFAGWLAARFGRRGRHSSHLGSQERSRVPRLAVAGHEHRDGRVHAVRVARSRGPLG